jgi:ketohexokinase
MPIYCTQFSIVFVGAPYVDTLLHVPEFPKEDHKMHINTVERRLGGNSVNTARALAVFSNVTCALVAAFPSLDASRSGPR